MRLLVVEDEVRLARALQRGLTAEGFAVDVAYDGETGLAQAREGGYDALVLDVMLPRLSGVVQTLRAEQNWVPVLMLSAKDGEYDQADGLDVGADDYLTKPFSYVVLVARLRALFRRGAPERPVVLVAGDLALDPAARRVTRGGVEVALTTREFALLEYLLRRPGEVVSKSELLEHVWGAYDAAEPNLVEVYVGYLRRKVDVPFGRRSLQTVRGAGYRIDAGGGWHPCWWRAPSIRGLSLRARLVLLGTAGLAVALAAGVVLLVGVLEFTLVRMQDAGAEQTARDVAALVDADRLPELVPVGGTTVVQVVDGQGRVRAGSAGADRLVPVLDASELATARAGGKRYLPGDRFGVNGVVRVMGIATGSPGDPQTVVVAVPAAELRDAVRLVRIVLGAGFGVLLLVLATLAWRIVGWTLRPVEALRRGAAAISNGPGGGGGTSGSLPVPESRDEIHRLAVTLNDMLDRLEATRRRQRAFVADAAHELRNPLASMRTQLEVAQAIGDTTGLGPDLLVDVERLSRLVDDLLLLARADDAGGAAARRQDRVDLAALVREASDHYASGRVPVAVIGDGTVVVEGDPDALRRVVANLLDNAVRHARTRAQITVRTDGPEAVVCVADDGPGIVAADRTRAFERFARLDEGRARDEGGAGLGLAIVRELVRLHGGRVELGDAEPGLRAEVHLPRTP